MGLRDFFRKLFRPDPYAAPDADRSDESDPSEGPPSLTPSKPEPDPLAEFAGLPVHEGVRRARRALDEGNLSRIGALTLLRWLRERAAHPELPAPARVELADFFLARNEAATADAMLRALAAGDARHAPPAMMRLGDLAAQSGDDVGAAGWYESALALDLEYPGARERRARLMRPARAGEAGATLLAPEASVAMGRFELVRELGRGGAGAVYLARDKRVGRQVALKIYHPQARADRNARLRGEAQVAASIASPGVVRVYDLFEDAGALAMEHVSGASLRVRVAKKSVTPAQGAAWLGDVARALALVHARGWVHRDLKPGNVLLRADGRAVLTDFGLARRVGQATPAAEGTAGYVPPEARGGGVAHPATDVYAFGALGRELLPAAPPALAALLRACLDDAPERRPADGGALVAALAGVG